MSQYSFLCDNFCCDILQVLYEMTCIIKTWQEMYSTNMTLRCQNSWGIKIGVWQNNYNASTFVYDILKQTKILQQISSYKNLKLILVPFNCYSPIDVCSIYHRENRLIEIRLQVCVNPLPCLEYLFVKKCICMYKSYYVTKSRVYCCSYSWNLLFTHW